MVTDAMDPSPPATESRSPQSASRQSASSQSASLLAGLNPAQRQAAEALQGPVCILAGAGTGKTRTITHRIAHQVLADVASPSEVLAVTFTDKAAGELRQRLRLLGVPGTIRAATFHAAAWAQLRHFLPQLGNGRLPEVLPSKVPVIRRVAGRIQADVRDLASEVEWAKARMLSPSDYERQARPATRRITGTLEGSTSGRRPLPSCGRKWRSCAQAAAWKVAARIVPGTPSSRSRWRSSPAALSVKVTASTSDGEATSASTWWAMRWVIVRVLPVPAPARMHTGPCSASAAWRWAGLSPASSDALWDDALWREALWGLRDSVAGGDGSMASVTITRTVRRSADTLPGGGDAASPGGRRRAPRASRAGAQPSSPARSCAEVTGRSQARSRHT